MEKMSWCDNLEVTVKYRMQISQTCVNLTTIRVEQFHDPVLTDLTHFFFLGRRPLMESRKLVAGGSDK